MNTSAYISSGILEAYYLGALLPEEMLGVEAAIAENAEVKAEADAIETALIGMLEAQAITPPPELKDAIWKAIEAKSKSNHKSTSDELQTETTKENHTKILALDTKSKFSFARAAVLAMLLGSAALNFYFYSQKSKTEERAVVAETKMKVASDERNNLLATLQSIKQEQEMMMNPEMQTVIMQPTKPGKLMAGMVYLNRHSGASYLSLHGMPEPEVGKQYQLWVIQNGKPVSLGMLGNERVAGDMAPLDKSNSPEGQAFAISLETEGGVEAPTADQIMVLGKVPG